MACQHAAQLSTSTVALPGKIALGGIGEDHPWYQEMAEHLHHNVPHMLAAMIEFDQMHERYDYEQLFPNDLRSCAHHPREPEAWEDVNQRRN